MVLPHRWSVVLLHHVGVQALQVRRVEVGVDELLDGAEALASIRVPAHTTTGLDTVAQCLERPADELLDTHSRAVVQAPHQLRLGDEQDGEALLVSLHDAVEVSELSRRQLLPRR